MSGQAKPSAKDGREKPGSMPKDAPKRQYRAVEDVQAAYEALSTADLIRLDKAAIYCSAGNWLVPPEDLLNEALTRALEGTRRWPEGVAFTTFLSNVMKSLAQEYRRQRTERPVVLDVDFAVEEADRPLAKAVDERP